MAITKYTTNIHTFSYCNMRTKLRPQLTTPTKKYVAKSNILTLTPINNLFVSFLINILLVVTGNQVLRLAC